MALTINSVTIEADKSHGDGRISALVDLDFDNSYLTGGELLDVLNDDAALKGGGWKWTSVSKTAALASGREVGLNAAGTTLMVFDNAGAEIAGAVDLSAMTDIVLRFQGI